MRAEYHLIRSRDNPRVRTLLKLAASARELRRASMTLLEGEHLIDEFRKSGGTAEVVVAGEAALEDPRLRSLLDQTQAKFRLAVGQGVLQRMSSLVTASGVLALVKTPAPADIPDSPSDCVLLDGIQDPGNLGSILRTAVAAGIRHVILGPGSAYAWAPKVVRSGMGAHFRLAVHEDTSLEQIAPKLGRIVATEPRARCSLFEADLSGPVAWLFGNEGAGLSGQAARLAAQRVSIPMPGPAESLNVAAAVAVCLFEQLRQRTSLAAQRSKLGKTSLPYGRRVAERGYRPR